MAILERELRPLVGGGDRLAFDILNRTMIVDAGAAGIAADEIVRAVARTGMRATISSDEAGDRAVVNERSAGRQTALTIASGVFGVAGFLAHAAVEGGAAALGSEGMGQGHAVPLAARVLYMLSIVAAAWNVAPKGVRAAQRLRPDMNLLMTLAVAGAVVLGEWLEAATVSFLFAVSLALESWSVGRARRAVKALLDLVPPMARLLEDGRERDVPPEAVAVGARFVVRPGERIPLDGCVVAGASRVNQAPITGESLPVAKAPGDELFAGTINGDAALEIECTKRAADTTLAHIVRMIGQARTRRAPSERWVERFARIYTPCVLAISLFVFVLPPLFFGAAWGDWFYRSLVFLVIGCPCALVISTPVSIVAALASSARNGVLIKGGVHLESFAGLRAMAFDKTGTLTHGALAVSEIVALEGHTEDEVVQRAAALEARSGHPIARAIMSCAVARGIDVAPGADSQLIAGKGASGRIEGREFWLGSHRYLEERGQETPEVHERLEAMSQAGSTIVVVGNAAHVCGFIALSDRVRENAAGVMRELRALGIAPLVILTGDNAGTAAQVARVIDVEEVRAELLPADKVAAVEELVAAHRSVAMVGDGVNDAPALAQATVGIAMAAAGSDAAIETADVALMSDDLTKLPWLVRHSRRTLGVVRQNIVFALSVKAIVVALALSGHASLWVAIAADMGASLLVIFNGLRLLTADS
ncbi:MAG: heavy metal translocating P-type ATPase [bacterium]